MKLLLLIPSVFFLILNTFSQRGICLYKDSEVKIEFKQYDNQYGYVTEIYPGAYHGALVRYVLKGDDCLLTELDEAEIIADTMLFYLDHKYQKDSLNLSCVFRINEFANASYGSSRSLTYIINDTMRVQVSSNNTDFTHGVTTKNIKLPYKLMIENGNQKLGPFIIDSSKDIEVIAVVLISVPNEYDFAKLLPKRIVLDRKKYNLKHTFEPWD
jgi:hypothetical protein